MEKNGNYGANTDNLCVPGSTPGPGTYDFRRLTRFLLDLFFVGSRKLEKRRPIFFGMEQKKGEVNMFNKSCKDGYSKPLAGIERKTLVYGKKTLMVEFRLQKGSIVPLHSHPHEQAGYLVSGQVKFLVGSEEIICNPGDSWCISGDEEHGGEALQDSVLVDIFSPIREDYMPE